MCVLKCISVQTEPVIISLLYILDMFFSVQQFVHSVMSYMLQSRHDDFTLTTAVALLK